MGTAVKVIPYPMQSDGNGIWASWYVPTNLIACDHCGRVNLDTPEFGWKRWHEVVPDSTSTEPVLRHHCPDAVEINEMARFGLGFTFARFRSEKVVDYEDWEE